MKNKKWIPAILIVIGFILVLTIGSDALWQRLGGLAMLIGLTAFIAWIASRELFGAFSFKNTFRNWFICLLFLTAFTQYATKEYPKNSNISDRHICTWCSKTYTGAGYMHIGNGCEIAKNGWERSDNKCSMKCCEEAWNAGKH
ncbi:MAG: hypothetical protein JWP12_2476 [Bacteroidetes bacterium]|nr:hypothetical protein [Bacteroidota bacterium]